MPPNHLQKDDSIVTVFSPFPNCLIIISFNLSSIDGSPVDMLLLIKVCLKVKLSTIDKTNMFSNYIWQSMHVNSIFQVWFFVIKMEGELFNLFLASCFSFPASFHPCFIREYQRPISFAFIPSRYDQKLFDILFLDT